MRLLRPEELPGDWDPATDPRLTVWEMVHHLIRRLEPGGEGAAAELVAKLGPQADVARELAYRLYTLCEWKEAGRRGPCLQRPRPELARDRPARRRGSRDSRAGGPLPGHRGVADGDGEANRLPCQLAEAGRAMRCWNRGFWQAATWLDSTCERERAGLGGCC